MTCLREQSLIDVLLPLLLRPFVALHALVLKILANRKPILEGNRLYMPQGFGKHVAAPVLQTKGLQFQLQDPCPHSGPDCALRGWNTLGRNWDV